MTTKSLPVNSILLQKHYTFSFTGCMKEAGCYPYFLIVHTRSTDNIASWIVDVVFFVLCILCLMRWEKERVYRYCVFTWPYSYFWSFFLIPYSLSLTHLHNHFVFVVCLLWMLQFPFSGASSCSHYICLRFFCIFRRFFFFAPSLSLSIRILLNVVCVFFLFFRLFFSLLIFASSSVFLSICLVWCCCCCCFDAFLWFILCFSFSFLVV